MSDTLIRVEGVSKKFCRSLKRSLWYGMQDLGNELIGRRHGGNGALRRDEFWAVKDVSFELKRGECLGLIGRNGAGKTTLLRMLNGLIKPDEGRIEIRGRMGALIALGAGFNPILTGRENIQVNASVLGLSKDEIDSRIDEIVEFAEIGESIDSPVQNYSSGMVVRLGFAAASVLDPDVLLLDEVLAVGDAAFRYKCYRRIDQLLQRAAVIFVSHDMPHVGRICTRTMLLSRGQIRLSGATGQAITEYQRLNDEAHTPEEGLVTLYPPITELSVGTLPEEIRFSSPLSLEITLRSDRSIEGTTLRVNVMNLSGAWVASCIADSSDFSVTVEAGRTAWKLELASLPLRAGRYYLSVTLCAADGSLLAVWHKGHQLAIVGTHPGIVGDCQLSIASWAPRAQHESSLA